MSGSKLLQPLANARVKLKPWTRNDHKYTQIRYATTMMLLGLLLLLMVVVMIMTMMVVVAAAAVVARQWI